MAGIQEEDRRLIPSRSFAEEADSRDDLAAFRKRFMIQPGPIYMDGNSLGRLPLNTSKRIRELVENEWGQRLVRAWDHWIDAPLSLGNQIAGLIGAEEGEVVVCDSTSVNLFKLAMGAMAERSGRYTILTDTENFPSDQYVLQGVARQTGAELRLFTSDPIFGPTPETVAQNLTNDVALVSLSHVGYKNAALADMATITNVVTEAGGLTLWDLCHSVGAVPVDVKGSGVHLAVGCTYKYLNSGPGAPAFLYVSREMQQRLRQPIWGWFGQRDQFVMGPDYLPQGGVGSFQVGTPPIVSMMAIETGVGLIIEAGVEALRAKSIAITQMMIGLYDDWLRPLGVELGSPREPSERGSHLSFRHPDGYRICRALIERMDVIPDFREPDTIRYGIAPIYTTFTEAWDAMDRLRVCIAERAFEDLEEDRARVT